MRSGPESFDSVDAQALAHAQQEEMRALYGGEADIGPTREAAMFVEPDGVFLVVRGAEGAAVACGGILRFDTERAELKRMYVLPAARGRGLGLYRSAGYERIPCYSPYDSRALSLCFEKRLPPLE